MQPISFMSANFVARELGFHMDGGWGQGDTAANEHYAPLETFRERFTDLVSTIAGLGFDAMDIWSSHLNLPWATDEHLDIAREVLQEHDMRVASYAGWFGSTAEELERSCTIATAIGTRVLGGSVDLGAVGRDTAAAIARRHGVVIAVENHPETGPDQILERIGDHQELAACVDTGWWATQGYDPPAALRALGPRIAHVHLKDVRSAGSHDSCPWGAGVARVRECVEALRELDYRGGLSIEHEPDHGDPAPACVQARAQLTDWLATAAPVR